MKLARIPGGGDPACGSCGPALEAARLQTGEHMLDLGCGSGRELLQAAAVVGASGQVYGLDIDPRALEQARQAVAAAATKTQAAPHNVHILQATAEAIPLPGNSLDVVMSNCALNLIANKAAVFAEVVRVLKPHGRCVIADIVALQDGTAPAGQASQAAESSPTIKPPQEQQQAQRQAQAQHAQAPRTPKAMLGRAASLLGCKNGVSTVARYLALMKQSGLANIEVRLHAAIPYSLIERRAQAAGRADELRRLDWHLIHDTLASVVFIANKN